MITDKTATITLMLHEYADHTFKQAVTEHGLTTFASRHWTIEKGYPVDRSDTETYGVPIFTDEAGTGGGEVTFYVGQHPRAISSLTRRGDRVSVQVAAVDDEHYAESIIDRMQAALPSLDEPDDKVVVHFWTGGQGTNARARTLDAPLWEDIQGNYPSGKMRDSLTELMTRQFQLDQGGKLILWHGDPGTGKTTAVRALAQAWRSWANIHYILDPEVFFGAQPDYMMDVLLESEQYTAYASTNDKGWQVVVLEDTGELLTRDAKRTAGQGLSRLLNVCDGMVGQGLKLLVLITSNEDIGVMHEAVTRPGRCAANVKFHHFNEAGAHEWLANNDAAMPEGMITGNHSLAELYALKDGRLTSAEPTRKIGWR